jgi:histidine triad (HIT) family protein
LVAVDGCPFCNYAGPVEDAFGDVIVIEPLNPVVRGHLLVIPREHVQDATHNPALAGYVMRVAALIARGLECNIITSVGPAATQTVMHLHVHIVPRQEGDGLRLPWS